MITTDLTTLKINKLTKTQYEAALASGNINENELYMTPESGTESGLPTVSSSDSGKTLVVNESGKWVADIVQPDWNVNDSTSASYVKNRPFYTGDLVETYVVQDVSLVFSAANGSMKEYNFPSSFNLVAGTTYKVYWNGIAYERVCSVVQGSAFVIGNLSITGVGDDTGEPFLIVTDNKSVSQCYTTDTTENCVVSISTLVPEIVKIDEKYLPIATNDSYGVVKTDRLVTFYNFGYDVPTSLLIEAIELFNQGRAAIRWNNNKVVMASVDSTRISLMLEDNIGMLYEYDKTLENLGFYNTINKRYIEFYVDTIRFYNTDGTSSFDSYICLSLDSDGNPYLAVDPLHLYNKAVELWMKSSASGSSKIVVHKFTTDDNNLMLDGKVIATENYVNKFKPTITTYTLTASNWDSTANTYSFESTYPNASYDIEVDIDGDRCTDEQLNAWIIAKPLASSTNKINAKGDIPTVDIPIILTVTPK